MVQTSTKGSPRGPVRVALPKGRLRDNVFAYFRKIGLSVPAVSSRNLVHKSPDRKMVFYELRNKDVLTFLDNREVDLAVIGDDRIWEEGKTFPVIADLPFGKCRLVFASADGRLPEPGMMKIATKFTRTARILAREMGFEAEIISLEGNVELAPLTGLAPYILDITESGETLRKNNLKVIKVVREISCRLLASEEFFYLRQADLACIQARLAGAEGK